MIVSPSRLALLPMVLGIDSAAAVALGSRDDGFRVQWLDGPRLQLNINGTTTYQIDTTTAIQHLGITLCQTAPNVGIITAENSWRVLSVATNKCYAVNNAGCPPDHLNGSEPQTISIGLGGAATLPAASLSNFFFCFSNDPNGAAVCQGYSPLFDVGLTAPGTVNSAIQTPTSAITVIATTSSSLILLQQPSITVLPTTQSATGTGLVTSALDALTSPTMVYTTISMTPSLTVTITPATDGADSTSAALASSSSSRRGPPIGAIIGGALGGLLIIVALLLLALFFLRRKHKQKKNAPEQVMLTRDMHIDSFSQNASPNEKYAATNSTAGGLQGGNDTTFTQSNSSLPIQRHSALPLLPYESPPSVPYSGIAARPPSPGARHLPVPGQATKLRSPLASPTHQPANLNHEQLPSPSPPPPYAHPPLHSPSPANVPTMSHPQPPPIALPTTLAPLSRNLSSSTNASIPLSTTSPEDAFSETFLDMPIFGDARHSPQFFEGRTITPVPSVSETRHTFLSEDEIMSEEELEEERRIDLAIAEAEERRRRAGNENRGR